MLGISKLTLQNAVAVLTLPFYLLLHFALRWRVRPAAIAPESTRWVISGHSGRVYADNAAVLHGRLLALKRDVTWISADDGITRQLRDQGATVLTRNSLAARRAIASADVLAYSHGPSDLDHLLVRHVRLNGMRVHLNHCMSHVKTWGTHPQTPLPDDFVSAPVTDAFDYMLASSERERENLLRSFPGAGTRIVTGGGAHLDPFMAARATRPGRTIVYFPTFRDTADGSRELATRVHDLANDSQLHDFLEREDYALCIVGHVNRGNARQAVSEHARVRFAPAQQLLAELLGSAALISDYSGVICDYLALDRPLAFFPFDKAEYLRTRSLYVPYDELVCGPEARDVPELVSLIVGGGLFERAPYEDRRRAWEARLFPQLAPNYAESTLQTIEMLIAARFARRAKGTH